MGKVYVYAVIVSVPLTLAALAIALAGIVLQDPAIAQTGSIILALAVITVIALLLLFKKDDGATD